MVLGTAGLQFVAAWAANLVASWVGPSRAASCFCEFAGPTPDQRVLDLLDKQLSRCGPEQLTLPACPPCVCTPTGYTLLFVVICAAVCFAGGILAERARPYVTARLLRPAADVVDTYPVGLTVTALPVKSIGGPTTPSSLRRHGA